MSKIAITTLTCNRCGWEWFPRSLNPPKNCANKKCKSPYWNKARVRKLTSR